MKLEQVLIGLLFFSMLMIAGALIFQDGKATYGITSDDTVFGGAENDSALSSTYNNIDEIKAITEDVSTSVMKVGESENFVTALLASGELLLKGAYNAVRLIASSFGLMYNMINALSSTLGLPGWFAGVLYTIFLCAVLFTIIYLLFRFKP